MRLGDHVGRVSDVSEIHDACVAARLIKLTSAKIQNGVISSSIATQGWWSGVCGTFSLDVFTLRCRLSLVCFLRIVSCYHTFSRIASYCLVTPVHTNHHIFYMYIYYNEST